MGISSSSSHLPGTLSSWKLPSPSWYPQKVIILSNSLGWQSWHNKRMAECYYLTLYATLDMTFSFFSQSSSMRSPSISPWRFISVTSWNHFKENGFNLRLDLYIKHRHQEGVPCLGWTYRICCFRWSFVAIRIRKPREFSVWWEWAGEPSEVPWSWTFLIFFRPCLISTEIRKQKFQPELFMAWY